MILNDQRRNFRLSFFILFTFCLIFNRVNGQVGKSVYNEPHMGTNFQIIIYSFPEKADIAAAKCFEEIKRIEYIFSNYNPESEVMKLTDDNEWQLISSELYELITISENVRKNSNGAFDIRLGKITSSWKEYLTTDVKDSIVFQEGISLKENALKLKTKKHQHYLKLSKGIQLDFGGIAKGYAIDKAFEILKNEGVKSALIDGGGDIRIGAPPPGKEAWIIDDNFIEEDGYLELNNSSITTSGDTYQFIEYQDHRYSHIINPETGKGIADSKVVTVISDSCTIADALSTALSVDASVEKKLKSHYNFKVMYKEGSKD